MNHQPIDLFDLKGKTALVTGASSGLGERFAQTLAQAKAKVVITARRFDKLDILAKEIKNNGGEAIPLQMDVASKDSVGKAVEKLSAQGITIDILVNNAGIAKGTSIFEPDNEDNFKSIMETNVLGLWYVTKAVACHMKASNTEGSIINISSINGSNFLTEISTGYETSKAAVIHLTKSLVSELARAKIRINCILPGLFRTPLTEGGVLSNQPQETWWLEHIPLNFIANPNDLDGLLLYLASNKASRYVTGTCVTIDGGISYRSYVIPS